MVDLIFAAAAETAATVAGAANEEQARWSYENIKDLTGYVLGILVAAFLAWQNALIVKQNVAHEENARERAVRRGDPDFPTPPFPGEKNP